MSNSAADKKTAILCTDRYRCLSVLQKMAKRIFTTEAGDLLNLIKKFETEKKQTQMQGSVCYNEKLTQW